MTFIINSINIYVIFTAFQKWAFPCSLSRLSYIFYYVHVMLSCRTLPLSVERNISIPLRMLEVFTNQKTYNWLTSEVDQSKIVLTIVSHLTTKGIIFIFKKKILKLFLFQDLNKNHKKQLYSNLESSIPFWS